MLGFKIGFWDYMTFAALAVIVFAVVLLMILILGLPGKIAIARKHPEADAVKLMGWVGVSGKAYGRTRPEGRRTRRRRPEVGRHCEGRFGGCQAGAGRAATGRIALRVADQRCEYKRSPG
ncbi:MAG: DUF3302 domain-containing protein [Desulfobacterales bacterium]